MATRIRARRHLLVLMMCALAIVVGAVPTADLFAFGLHTHVAVSERREAEVSAPDGGNGQAMHHCELSASPGVVAPACGPLAPTLVASLLADARPFAVDPLPLVLSPPPRA